MDAEKAASIRRARELLDRLDEQDRQRSSNEFAEDALAEREWQRPLDLTAPARMQNAGGQLPLLPSTAMNRYRAEAEEQEERRRRSREEAEEQERQAMNQRSADWSEWHRAELELALQTEGHILHDTLACLIAELRGQWRDEIASAVGELRAELAVQKSAERQAEKDTVLDLPRQFWRRDVA
jgi:hypothetical protein